VTWLFVDELEKLLCVIAPFRSPQAAAFGNSFYGFSCFAGECRRARNAYIMVCHIL
jgi:hypothetical protein